MLFYDECLRLVRSHCALAEYGVRDVWQHKDIARNAKRWKGTVASHETKVFILK